MRIHGCDTNAVRLIPECWCLLYRQQAVVETRERGVFDKFIGNPGRDVVLDGLIERAWIWVDIDFESTSHQLSTDIQRWPSHFFRGQLSSMLA